MKLTVSQLRRIIKEEVSKRIKINESDKSREDSLLRAIEELEVLRDDLVDQGIDTSELQEAIDSLQSQLDMPEAF